MGVLLEIAAAAAPSITVPAAAPIPPAVAADDSRLRDPAFRRGIIAARDAAHLEEWRAPLALARLHLCGNCSLYAFGSNPAGAGTCTAHGDGLLAFAMPFDCRDFQVSATPTAPAYQPI